MSVKYALFKMKINTYRMEVIWFRVVEMRINGAFLQVVSESASLNVWGEQSNGTKFLIKSNPTSEVG